MKKTATRADGYPQPLRGRRDEIRTLDELIDAVRAGESRALVLRGEPGVGKTALLEYLVEHAEGWRVARAAGAQAERELAYAGLHQLCGPMLDRLEALPGPQRDALCTAFGLITRDRPDGLLVGLAALDLLAEVARDEPLLCVMDDAQWLDQASGQALALAARRLQAESVAMVFAVRESPDVPESEGRPEFARLPELRVAGLPDDAACALLVSTYRGPADAQVIDRIVAETRGNPLALLELPRTLTPAELAGGFGWSGEFGLPDRIEESFRRQLASLEAETRLLLLVAAAEPTGDPVLMWRASACLGVGPDAAAPAVAAGLITIAAQTRFRHPLLRSAVYWTASAGERRDAHRALAEATSPQADPDRHAWHRAQAVAGPDEDIAAELERSAVTAQARGGLAAAAAFLSRAAELTPGPAQRAGRALAAAQAKQKAGAADMALGLLALAEAGPLGDSQRAQADLLRAEIALSVRRGSQAPGLLLTAAKRLAPIDVRLARGAYLEAASAAMFAGPLSGSPDARETAEAARAAPAPPDPPRPVDLLLDGLVMRFAEGFPAAVPMLRQALAAFRDQDLYGHELLRWVWYAYVTAGDIWDDESFDVLTARHVQLARDTGALSELHLALTSRIGAQVYAGELAEAASSVRELDLLVEATGVHRAPYGALLLAAWQGSETMTTELVEVTTKDVLSRGEGIGLTVTGWAQGVLYNSLGRYEEAMEAARRATLPPQEMGTSTWGALAELIEAATRSGRPDLARGALGRLAKATRASGTDWALGIEARSRALLSQDGAAESAYKEAIDRLGRTRIRAQLARAYLLYGEWLRRQLRRLEAREQLRIAHEMFTVMGMEAFAQRAAQELLATGETARKRTVTTTSKLTAQEEHIARLAGQGLSNPEIATRLFISVRTVEWHLRHIFEKRQISSRRELRH